MDSGLEGDGMQVWIMSERWDGAERDHPWPCPAARALGEMCGPVVDVKVGERSVEFRRESARTRQTVIAVSNLPDWLPSAIRTWDEGGPFPTGRGFTVRVLKSFIRPKVVMA